MKIVFLNPSGRMGGAERALLDLIAAVAAANPSWKLSLIAGSPGELVDEVRALGIRAEVFDFPASIAALGDAAAGGPAGYQLSALKVTARMCAAAPSMMPLAYRLARLLADIRPTLIHANGLKMHVLGAWVSPVSARLIWHVHDYVGKRPIMSRLLRLHARRCACILANSHSVADDIRACVGIGAPVLTVHNAVDVSRFSSKGAVADLDQLARMRPAPKDCLRIGMPATMARWKGHRVFLKALSMLPRSMSFRGYVIGGPLYATYGSQSSIEDLRRFTIELGIEDRVGFTGFIADAPAAIRALDAVVHASTEPEPFGLIIAEAMACEKPVIATAAGGAMEIVSDGNNAIAYPPGDADALAAAIARLASDPGLRARLGAAGRKTVESRFTREHLANRITPIYRELAASDASFEPLGNLG